MRVLFLGDPAGPLTTWLREAGEAVTATADRLDPASVSRMTPDLILCADYLHIIPAGVAALAKHGAVSIKAWRHPHTDEQGVTLATLYHPSESIGMIDRRIAKPNDNANPHDTTLPVLTDNWEMLGKERSPVQPNNAIDLWEVTHAPPEALITLKQATPADDLLIWQWRNHPKTRPMMLHPDPIPLNEHRQWFLQQTQAGVAFYLIISRFTTRPVGVIRFNRSGTTSEIHIILDPTCTGRGMGTQAIALACTQYLQTHPIESIVASILPENIASQRAFEHAGFQPTGEKLLASRTVLGYQWADPKSPPLIPTHRVQNAM